MINRLLKPIIQQKLFKNKAIIIFGARQVGKTTLLNDLIGTDRDILWLSGDDIDIHTFFAEATSTSLKVSLAPYKIVVIDEAQRIADIGLKLKLITDHVKDIQLIATGSSSFDLANKVNEPLTGRKWEYKMFPLSFAELVEHHGLLTEKRLLNHRLVYGYYPDIVANPDESKALLKQLSDSYLYKDILMWEQIQKPDKVLKLLQALAYQIGSQVSFNELGQTCGLDSKTVEKYINLLEQTFVIFRLSSFSRNLRNELKSSKKIYFYDNGIRNALIANFSGVESRSDVGALWENFLIAERIKYLHYSGQWVNSWFWRTKDQKEIDFIEESDGKLSAFEFKWKVDKAVKVPKAFILAYPESAYKVINPSNFEEFVM